MQDWVTVRGAAAATIVLQPETDYLDISAFQDFASYVEVSEIVAAATVKLQTAPLKEEGYFTDLVTVPATGVTRDVVRYSAVTTPPARWLRWKCSSGSASWSITFRIHLNANPAGSP
jgi:hypothetical protein